MDTNYFDRVINDMLRNGVPLVKYKDTYNLRKRLEERKLLINGNDKKAAVASKELAGHSWMVDHDDHYIVTLTWKEGYQHCVEDSDPCECS